jgi:pimeloyl-ACP methyl ester carboxylesterase
MSPTNSASSALVYDRDGSGEPLVLVHGLGSRRQVWQPVFDAVARHRDVVAVDLPGFGESAPGDVTPSETGFADRLEAFFTELGVDRPHVAGSSMGGGIALELGRRGAARSVTVFSPVGFWNTPERIWAQRTLTATRALARRTQPYARRLLRSPARRAVLLGLFYGKPRRLDPDFVADDVAALLNAVLFEQARDAFAGYHFNRFADAGSLPDIPVTVAWGTRDALLVHRTQSRRARRLLPFATHVDLPGCGHLPFADDPARCTEVLLDGSPPAGGTP